VGDDLDTTPRARRWVAAGVATVLVVAASVGALTAAMGSSSHPTAGGHGAGTVHLGSTASSAPTESASPVTPTTGATSGGSPAAGADWSTYHGSGARAGVDPSGASLSPARPAWTSVPLGGRLYAEPLVVGGRVIAATEGDTVVALSAHSGAVLWKRTVGSPFRPSTVPGLCGDISPTVGITSTPVVDVGRGEVFVVADVQAGPSGAAHHLVGLDLATGTVLLDQVIDPTGTDPSFELQRAGLALTAGRVIVGFGGNYGDCGPYHGLVVSVPEGGGPSDVFAVDGASGQREGAVWMGGAAPAIDGSGNVWVATGNGSTTRAGAPYDHSDAVLELSPTMRLLQYFAPPSWRSDNAVDADLGSTAPMVLGNGLVFQVGKSQTGYLLRQGALGGIGGQVTSARLCPGAGGNDADGGSAWDAGILYIPCSRGIQAVAVGASPPSLSPRWVAAGGASGPPVVAGGLVWSETRGGVVEAIDPATGATVQRFSVGAVATSFPAVTAADGLVLAVGSGEVHAFCGPAGPPPPE
jgi:outer membrane protein assembly factor BamB